MPTGVESLELDNLSADPTSPPNGKLWYRTDDEVVKAQISGAAQVVGRVNNFAATRSPNASDDSTDEYSVGSLWFDTTNGVMWHCIKNLASGAEWRPMTSKLIRNATHSNTTSTTSTTWEQLDGFVVVQPPMRGRFLITLSCHGDIGSSSDDGEIALSTKYTSTVSTTPISGTIRQAQRGNNAQRFAASLITQAVLLLDGSEKVTALRRTPSGANTWSQRDTVLQAELIGFSP